MSIIASYDTEDVILLKRNMFPSLNPSLDCCDKEKLKPKNTVAEMRSSTQDPECIIVSEEGGKAMQGEKTSHSSSFQKYFTIAAASQQNDESSSSVFQLRRDSSLTISSTNLRRDSFNSISVSTDISGSFPFKLNILRMLQRKSCRILEIILILLSNNNKPCQIFAVSSNSYEYLDDKLTIEASFGSESYNSLEDTTATQQQQQQNFELMKPPKEVILIEEKEGSRDDESISLASTSQSFREGQHYPEDCIQHHIQMLQTENDRLYVELRLLREELRDNREPISVNKYTFAVLVFILIILCATTSMQ
eukprot:CAMPEP_0194138044 /NCGR_PEP_ID=MMETSP0152-20130528/7894_1 /TAXON_ID=1049557 /ORGANISM="Thalassiothrix antarctica, Strain L6-D1" /LENGTH=306 /DNA_ID=CAMNT_0038835337 /DNA_START=55 /DNA_END=975 /DNA_ORIENTATION=+